MTPDSPPPEPGRPVKPRRRNRRLRFLLALTVLSLGLYVFVRLDRSVAERLGPVGEGVYDLFNPVPGRRPPRLTATARQFQEDVKELGGAPNVSVTRRGYLGTIGQTEILSGSFRNPEFDDAALARLAERHGDRILNLDLQNTGVTDAGLESLSKFTALRHLSICSYPRRIRRGDPVPPSKITDEGLAHLKELTQLQSLRLDGLPITDAGLAAINDLPNLHALYLSRTEVRGHGLAKLKSLPRLTILVADQTGMTDDGLRALSGATRLRILSLNRVPLTESALPLLKAIPVIDKLELNGCGFLDEEIDALRKSKPALKVRRD